MSVDLSTIVLNVLFTKSVVIAVSLYIFYRCCKGIGEAVSSDSHSCSHIDRGPMDSLFLSLTNLTKAMSHPMTNILIS